MTEEVSDILKRALALPPDARAAIAGSLLESLDPAPHDDGVDEAWSHELQRRIADVDSGRVTMIPYDEVRRRLIARLSDPVKPLPSHG